MPLRAALIYSENEPIEDMAVWLEEHELGLGATFEGERRAVRPEEADLAREPRPLVDGNETGDLPARPGLPLHPERHEAIAERSLHGGAASRA